MVCVYNYRCFPELHYERGNLLVCDKAFELGGGNLRDGEWVRKVLTQAPLGRRNPFPKGSGIVNAKSIQNGAPGFPVIREAQAVDGARILPKLGNSAVVSR